MVYSYFQIRHGNNHDKSYTRISNCQKRYEWLKNANPRHIYQYFVSPINDVYFNMKSVIPFMSFKMSNELLEYLSAINPLYIRLIDAINDDFDEWLYYK